MDLLFTIITAATPLLLAAIGEMVVERSGVLNLGVEGMMIMGAVSGFAVAYHTGSPELGVAAALCAGLLMASLFACLTQFMLTNQVATGLALTLFGLGLSGMLGEKLVGFPGVKLEAVMIPGLSDIPYIGPLLFGHDILVYISVTLVLISAYIFKSTRLGLIIKAVGTDHHSAHALGYPVRLIRFGCILFGGACAGLAGAYLSLVYTPQWVENMTSGRGWIALALVVFATWLPYRIAIGAYLFGSIWIFALSAQAYGVAIPSQFLSALPYLITILALIGLSGNRLLKVKNTPNCLGQIFKPTR